MNPFSQWRHRRSVDGNLAYELAEHLAEKIEELRQEGHSEQESVTLAHRQFGDVALIQEDSRSEWGWNLIEQLWQDIRFGWRVLKNAPLFTATVILVLALGIGMNTAMFSALKAVLLSALPYPEPERMVRLNQTAEDGHLRNVSRLDFTDWRSQTRTVESMAAYGVSDSGVTVSGDFPARQARMANVTTDFFRVMATEPIVGRVFGADEQKPGGPFTLVVEYELAQSVFGAPANALQKSVRLNGLMFTVIGVMPPRFDFPESTEIWLLNDLFPDQSTRSAHNYRVVGRLKPGVQPRQAQADMDLVAARLAKQYVDDQHEGVRVTSLYDSIVGAVRPALMVLFGAVALVLLIASVNVSSLLLARAAARRKEMAMRGALGAGSRRLIRQLLTESIMLSATGGLVGLLLARAAVAVFRSTAPINIPRIQNLTIDGGVLGFTAGLSVWSAYCLVSCPRCNLPRSTTMTC